MSEELTQNPGGRESFESRVLAELARINNQLTTGPAALGRRLTALAERVDARLQETRPIWEAVLSLLDVIESKVEALSLNLLDMRGDWERVKKRIPPAA